jgi:hypothetical protein
MYADAIDTQAKPADTYQAFKRWMTLAIVANLLVGLALLLAPLGTLRMIGIDAVYPDIWIRYVGLFLIILTLGYIPIRIMPAAYLPLAFHAVILRVLFVLFFLYAAVTASGGFLWFALYDIVFGILLGTSLWEGYRAELMSRP